MPEENQNQKPIQTPEQADPKYKETLLLYNEQNGAVEAVSDLKQSGNQYKVTTTQPLTANKPAFYELRNSSAVAAFIKGFMSQENAKPFHFLKVAADKASEVTQSLLRLADNPKDPEGLKALYDHRVLVPTRKGQVRHSGSEVAGAERDGYHRYSQRTGGDEARPSDDGPA